MCRLLGYVVPTGAGSAGRPALGPDTDLPELLSEQGALFHGMARLHRDGWGTAWHQDGALRARVSPETAWGGSDLPRVLADSTASARIVHLRLASAGMAKTAPNTHPFVAGSLAFAHNGALEPLAALDRLVSRRRAAELTGTTDSERYFAAIRTRLDRGESALEATARIAGLLRDAYPTRSLNALLLTPDELIAVHASRHAPIPRGEFLASGLEPHEIPRHHDECYYLMRIRHLADGAVVVASSGLDDDDWQPLPDESVTRIDLVTGETQTVLLDEAERAADVA